MRIRAALSRKSDLWTTPIHIYCQLEQEFKFDFDPCPTDPDFDGLAVEWGQSNFVNPPYSDLKNWIRKGYEEHLKGKTVVFLIPSRTDTIAWHRYVMRADEVRFFQGRLSFSGGSGRAPFPSALVVFRKKGNGPTLHR